jgi:hypothetical protein
MSDPIRALLLGGPRDGEEVVLPPNTFTYPVAIRFGIGMYEARRDHLGIVLPPIAGLYDFDWMA